MDGTLEWQKIFHLFLCIFSQPGNRWLNTRFLSGFVMQNLECGRTGGRNASLKEATGMQGKCIWKEAINISFIVRNMDTHPSLDLKMLLMNGKQKNGIPKQLWLCTKKPAPGTSWLWQTTMTILICSTANTTNGI